MLWKICILSVCGLGFYSQTDILVPAELIRCTSWLITHPVEQNIAYSSQIFFLRGTHTKKQDHYFNSQKGNIYSLHMFTYRLCPKLAKSQKAEFFSLCFQVSVLGFVARALPHRSPLPSSSANNFQYRAARIILWWQQRDKIKFFPIRTCSYEGEYQC